MNFCGHRSTEACSIRFHIIDNIKEETLQAVERQIDQWRLQMRSLELLTDEHFRPDVWEESREDGFGNVRSHCFRGEVSISEEALAKIKQ
jgi:hypothetical protein